jgi:hypothetical protein
VLVERDAGKPVGRRFGADEADEADEVAGIRLPTKHRIFPRTPDGQSLAEPLVVSIDLSEIAFTLDHNTRSMDQQGVCNEHNLLPGGRLLVVVGRV